MLNWPLWLQFAIGALFISALFPRMGQSSEDLSAAARTTQIESLWHRFSALSAILRSQSRRFGEVDAALGVIAVLQGTAAVWLFDKTYGFASPPVGAQIVTWFMLVPIAVAIIGMCGAAGVESPEPREFLKGLDEDETAALRKALDEIADDFESNHVRLQTKLFAMSLSLGLFIADGLALVLGHMVRWW